MSRYLERTSLWTPASGKLPTLDMELTERCDNRCYHCCIGLPREDARAQARETPAPRLQRWLEEAAALGCLQVRFTGGEPLLRDDFPDLYLYARRLGMRVMLFTNARRITPQLADLFRSVPPLLPIEVSVYGMNPRSYEAVTRVPGSYAEFRLGLAELEHRQVPFVAKWVALPANMDEWAAFRDWAATIPWMTRPPAPITILQLRSRRDSQKRNLEIANLRIQPEQWIERFAGDDTSRQSEVREFCGRFMGPKGDLLFHCGFGDTPCIDAYGRLQPCLSMRAPEMAYDLDRGSFIEALTVFFPSFRGATAKNPEYKRRCSRCFLMGLCNQCPAWSWTEHGNLDTPVEYLCGIAHAQARHWGLLKEKQKGWETSDWRERLHALDAVEKSD